MFVTRCTRLDPTSDAGLTRLAAERFRGNRSKALRYVLRRIDFDALIREVPPDRFPTRRPYERTDSKAIKRPRPPPTP